MKPVYILVGTILFFVTSCKKNTDAPDIFQVSVGNTTYTFDSTYATIDNSNPSAYFVTLYGKDTKSNSVFLINAQSVPKTNVGGTYSNTASTQGSAYNILNAGFNITTGTSAGLYSTNNQYTFTLDLSNPDNGRLKGSLLGRLVSTNPGNPQATDQLTGQFKIPYKTIP